MDARVAGIELGSLSLFGLPTSAGAAYDDSDVVWSMVLEETAVVRCLACGDDGELGGSISRDDDAGLEVLTGVEVFDSRRLGKAETLGFAGSFRKEREGCDAGGTGKKSSAKVFYIAAYGSDASETGNYNAIHMTFFAAASVL
jgi:hypothetical protein